MSQISRLAVTQIEEVDVPRPHYQVRIRGAVTALLGERDHTAGLQPEEVVMTVCLPIDIGTDLLVIKRGATDRAVALLGALMRPETDPTEASRLQLDREIQASTADLAV